MKRRTLLSLCMLIPAQLVAELALACPQLNHAIKDTTMATVGVFDDNGKVKSEAPKADVLKKVVTACNEIYNLVQVTLADNKSVWLDIAELKFDGMLASENAVCVANNNTAPKDKRQVVSSGATDPKCPAPTKK